MLKEKISSLYTRAAEKVKDVYYRKLDKRFAPEIETLTIDAVKSIIQQYPFEVELIISPGIDIASDIFIKNANIALCEYTILRGPESNEIIEETLRELSSDEKTQNLIKYEQSRKLMRYF